MPTERERLDGDVWPAEHGDLLITVEGVAQDGTRFTESYRVTRELRAARGWTHEMFAEINGWIREEEGKPRP